MCSTHISQLSAVRADLHLSCFRRVSMFPSSKSVEVPIGAFSPGKAGFLVKCHIFLETVALTYNLQEQKPWIEVLIEGSVFKSLDLGHYISWSFFFPPENVIQEQHQWPDSAVQSHQWAAIDGRTCAEMFLLKMMHSHQCDRVWRITPKLHRNIIQPPWEHFCLSSWKQQSPYCAFKMCRPIPEQHKQSCIKPQGVQMPLCHIWSTHTLVVGQRQGL